jgi:DnaJ-class molecular chaperone
MRKSLGAWLRNLGYSLIHLAHRVDPVKGPFECPRCGGQGSILVRSMQAEGGFVRQTCAFCKGRGSVMDRRSGVDRRRAGQAQTQPNAEAEAQAQAQAQAQEASQQSSTEQTGNPDPAPAPAATNPKAGE